MEENITITLTGETAQMLRLLSDSLGFSPEMTAQYEGEDGAAAMLQEFGLITQVDDGETQRTGGDVRVESGADGLTLYQPFDLGIQLSAEQGFTVRFWAGDMGPMTVEYTAAGAASEEITPWPSEMENDPVSIDPADYGIVYDAAHLPDW